MATDTTSNGSVGTPEAATTEAADAGSGVKDILVDAGEGNILLSGAQSDVSIGDSGRAVTAGDVARVAVPSQDQAVLELKDVLQSAELGSVDPDTLGAYLKVETVGSNTVISLDADGAGGGAAVAVVTLEGVSGMTLQQLLTYNQIIT